MKKCPYCAEEIQDEAIFCRYCKLTLSIDENKKTNESLTNPELTQIEFEESVNEKRKENIALWVAMPIGFILSYTHRIFLAAITGNNNDADFTGGLTWLYNAESVNTSERQTIQPIEWKEELKENVAKA